MPVRNAKPLVERVDAFIERYKLTPTVFGRESVNDPAFVFRLRGGRRVFPETEQKVVDFMKSYRPASR